MVLTALFLFLHYLISLRLWNQAFDLFQENGWGLFINTFDPVIFSAHIIGFAFWLLGASPVKTFLIIYFLLVLYYLKRFWQKKVLERKIRRSFYNVEGIFTSPTISQKIWRVAITTKDKFYVARANDGNIQIVDQFERTPVPDTELMRVAKTDQNVDAFLSFSKVYRWEQTEYDAYTEVRFIDLRYRSKDHYPFVAVVKITKICNIKIIHRLDLFRGEAQDKYLLKIYKFFPVQIP